MNIPNMMSPEGKGRRPFPGAVAVVATVGLSLAACDLDNVLDVPDPDVVLPELTRTAEALPTWRASVIGEFAAAYSGTPGQEGQILTSGLLADEFFHSGTFGTRREIENRAVRVENATTQAVFRTLHRARNLAEVADEVYLEFGADQPGRSEVLGLAGFTYLFFGENYCPGVPFSRFDIATGDIAEYGEPLATEQIFERALTRFQEAAGVSEATDDLRQLAAIGMGRALLNLGRFDEAAAAVAGVDDGFAYVIHHSDNTARQNNGVWAMNNNQGRWSIANRDGGTGLPYMEAADAGDPRIAYEPITAFAFGVDAWGQLKYWDRDVSIPLATGVEARLIEAEAALRGGRTGEFVAIHDGLRVGVGLDALDIDGLTQDELVDLHFEERAYWLWLSSHRLGDMRRLVRQYGRDVDAVFPDKPGDQVSFPVPVDEENNPEFDRTDCDPYAP